MKHALTYFVFALWAGSFMLSAQAAPTEDVGKDVANTLEKAGDNLDKSMKTISNNVRKGVSSAAASANAKVKESEKPAGKSQGAKAPYTIQKAESDLNTAGKNLDNSMKAVSHNIHKSLDQANQKAAAKKP